MNHFQIWPSLRGSGGGGGGGGWGGGYGHVELLGVILRPQTKKCHILKENGLDLLT